MEEAALRLCETEQFESAASDDGSRKRIKTLNREMVVPTVIVKPHPSARGSACILDLGTGKFP